MSESIFLINSRGELEELNESGYLSEDELQKLLAQYPNLISGKQINNDNPRRWLLVTREMGVPDELAVSNRWSIDHLFLDQEGIPTLVEVKRSNDTRIRREVVGQILDYAANAVVYWKIDDIIDNYSNTCQHAGLDSQERLRDFLDYDMEGEEFWKLVETNLKAGRIRMIIIADSIPKELKRIIEFLNEQLNPSEFFGLEIKQFSGQEIKTLVPRVIGNTSSSEISRGASQVIKVNRDENAYLEEFEQFNGQELTGIVKEIMKWAKINTSRTWYGHGKIGNGSMIPVLEFIKDGTQVSLYPFSLWVYRKGTIEINFQYLKNYKPFDQLQKREELLRKLNSIDGINLPLTKIDKRPSFNIGLLIPKGALNNFLGICEWIFNEVKEI